MSFRGGPVAGVAVVVAVLVWWMAKPAVVTAPAPAMSDVAYASASPAQVLDVWLPSGSPRPYPMVIFVHGGGFAGGDKRDVGPKLGPLLQRGFAVASVNYRLSGEAHFPDPVRDLRAAVRFLRAHATAAGVDPDRFALWGESAGANLATVVGVTADQPTIFDDPDLGGVATSAAVQAVVEWYGPIDFQQRENQFRTGVSDCRTPQFAEADGYTTGYLGADVDRVPQVALMANPITYVRRAGGLPPFSIAHGSADCLVPVGQAQQLADALRASGGRIELHVVPGAVHADPYFDRDLLRPTVDWLSSTLGRKS